MRVLTHGRAGRDLAVEPRRAVRASCRGASCRSTGSRSRYRTARRRGDDPYAFPPTLGELDLHLIGEGRHVQLYDGSARTCASRRRRGHRVRGLGAERARGQRRRRLQRWDGRAPPDALARRERRLGAVRPRRRRGRALQVRDPTRDGPLRAEGRPVRATAELPPRDGLDRLQPQHAWQRRAWLERARRREPLRRADLDLRGAPRLVAAQTRRRATARSRYRELADELGAYVRRARLHARRAAAGDGAPFDGSWGYQVTGYFAPTSRFGTPDDFRAFVDRCTRRGIGVILDWVPAHFPTDDWALAPLRRHRALRARGPAPGRAPLGHFVFNSAAPRCATSCRQRALLARRVPRRRAARRRGRLDALPRLLARRRASGSPTATAAARTSRRSRSCSELNDGRPRARPRRRWSVAEESTAWPGVTRPTYARRARLRLQVEHGLDARHARLLLRTTRSTARYHHDELTFGLLYAFTENFVLPLSHDEVVHGKGSLLAQDAGRPLAAASPTCARSYALHVGASGQEAAVHGRRDRAGARVEPRRAASTGTCSSDPQHAGVQQLVRDLNRLYREQPALHASATPTRRASLDRGERRRQRTCSRSCDAAATAGDVRSCVCNFSPVPRRGYRVGVPHGGRWREVLNTDAARYGGCGVGNDGDASSARGHAVHGQPQSLRAHAAAARRRLASRRRPRADERSRRCWPGRPYPLGATWDGSGVELRALLGARRAVELCLFDATAGARWRASRCPNAPTRSGTATCPACGPGQLLRLPRLRPVRSAHGHRFNPHKLLLDPYAKAIDGAVALERRAFGYRVGRAARGPQLRPARRRRRRCRSASSSTRASPGSDDRRRDTPWTETVIYEMHVQRLHEAASRACAQDLRGTSPGLASRRRRSSTSRRSASRRSSCCRCTHIVDERFLVERGLRNYWGYNPIGFFAPHAALPAPARRPGARVQGHGQGACTAPASR